MQWRDELESAATRVVVAESDNNGEAEGFVSAALAGDEFEIRKIGVIAPARRRGIARTLLAQVFNRMQAENPTLQRCLIDVAADNGTAIAFYSTQGFTEIARRRKYYAHGADAIVMEKILSGV